MVDHLLKSPYLYGTRNFIIIFTRNRHLRPSCAGSVPFMRQAQILFNVEFGQKSSLPHWTLHATESYTVNSEQHENRQ
jgi:hypothetical protein